jgi:hypothetical protein
MVALYNSTNDNSEYFIIKNKSRQSVRFIVIVKDNIELF